MTIKRLGMDYVNRVIKGHFTKKLTENDHSMVIFLSFLCKILWYEKFGSHSHVKSKPML